MSETPSNARPTPVALNQTNRLIIDTHVRPIYPVRYAYVNFFGEQLSEPVAPPPLSSLLNTVSITDGQGYAARLLRPGWIYIREEDGGGYFHIFKYEQVEKDGELQEQYHKYLFNNKINAQRGLVKEFAGASAKGYPFVFVGKNTTEISIAYSEHEWDADVIDTMNGDAETRAQAMQRVTLTGEDDATLEATPENLSQLVEDYREQQNRLLTLASDSTEDPSVQEVGLDIMTTQSSYELDPHLIALELRKKSQYGEVARIVGLYDPVGRQRDIAEVHAKLALWEQHYASQHIYPYTIGMFVRGFRDVQNEKVQKIVQNSINWSEHDEYWGKMDGEFRVFRERMARLTELYYAFMTGKNGLGGEVGSLDTYFKHFFCQTPSDPDSELEKLCNVAAGIFTGITISPSGQDMIERVMEDFEGADNAYYSLFKAFEKIVTTPQRIYDWSTKSILAVDKVFQVLGATFGKLAALAVNGGQFAWKTGNRLSFNALDFITKRVIPRSLDVYGIRMVEGRATFTPDELSKVLAQHIQEGVSHFPRNNPGHSLDNAVRRLNSGQKLFNWNERFKKGTLESIFQFSITQYEHVRGERFAFYVPENVTQFTGLLFDKAFIGLSIFCNVDTMTSIANQTQYSEADPLKRGSAIHSSILLTSTISAMTFDMLAASRAGIGGLHYIADRSSTALARAVLPGLSRSAGYLKVLSTSGLLTRLIVVANLGAVVVSFWDGMRAIQADNTGEAVGHFMLAAGSGLVVAHALMVAGAAGATGSGALSTTVVGIPLAVITGIASLIVLGVGAGLVWLYKKPGFQVLLENCFWGSGDKYLFWDTEKERRPIDKRLEEAKDLYENSELVVAYQVELQEFINYLNMPSLELERDTPFAATLRDLPRTYTYTFKLPNFQLGVSDIEFGLYTFSAYDELTGQIRQEVNGDLTQELSKSIERAIQRPEDIRYDNGSAIITISLELKERANLIWIYKPQPDQIVPIRYLTEYGLNRPIIGMINEDAR